MTHSSAFGTPFSRNRKEDEQAHTPCGGARAGVLQRRTDVFFKFEILHLFSKWVLQFLFRLLGAKEGENKGARRKTYLLHEAKKQRNFF